VWNFPLGISCGYPKSFRFWRILDFQIKEIQPVQYSVMEFKLGNPGGEGMGEVRASRKEFMFCSNRGLCPGLQGKNCKFLDELSQNKSRKKNEETFLELLTEF
jgi:hypothetical protein